MISPSNPLTLLQVELEQMRLVRTFIEEDREALVGNKMPVALAYGVPKLAVIDESARLADVRHTVVRAAGFKPDEEGTLAWIKTDPEPEEALKVWNELLATTAIVKDINRINGVIISNKAEAVTRDLHRIQRERNGGATYGPDGKARTNRPPRPSLEG